MSIQQPHNPFPDEEVLVSPRYLAGSNGFGDAGFAPVAHWPHHYLDEGPCQLLVTSPDQRIRIGWFGDDFELWRITAAENAVSAPLWTATFNHVTPAEIVAGLTTALAHDYAADAYEGNGRFLTSPSSRWPDAVQPLTDAGWTRDGGAEGGTLEIVAPDGQAGILIDHRRPHENHAAFLLWAGPPGWDTRAEVTFTTRTPPHLIATTAAAMADPSPVMRERHQIHPRVRQLVTLTPASPPAPESPRIPTPLDVRRTAVAQAVQRAIRSPQTETDLRVMAARSRTTGAARNRSSAPATSTGAGPVTSPAVPRRGR